MKSGSKLTMPTAAPFAKNWWMKSEGGWRRWMKRE
jgi:hypothetical protein